MGQVTIAIQKKTPAKAGVPYSELAANRAIAPAAAPNPAPHVCSPFFHATTTAVAASKELLTLFGKVSK